MLLSKHSRVMLSSPLLMRPHVVSAHSSLSKGHTIQPTSIKGPFYPEHACESMWIYAIPTEVVQSIQHVQSRLCR